MIKVNLDVTSLGSKHLTGIGVYTKNLALWLNKHNEIKLSGTFRLSRLKKLSHINAAVKEVPVYPSFDTLSTLGLRNFDIFHGPDFRVPDGGPFARVVTVHDLVVFRKELNDPAWAQYGTEKLRYLLEKSKPDHIITVSHFMAREIAEAYPRYAEHISVVYHGIDHMPVKPKGKYEGKPYILYIGTVERRKNVGALVKAFNIMAARHPDVNLVICGKQGFAADEVFNEVASSAVKSRIVVKDYISADELQNLMNNARMFVYPSLYEGFGIPILEAMRNGTPVITSNMGAMEEVANGAALLANPYQPEDLAHKIERLLEDNALRYDLIKAGLANAATFTWQTAADETVDAYKKAIMHRKYVKEKSRLKNG